MRLTSGAYLVICSSCDEGLPAMFQVFPVLLTSALARLLACHSNGKFGKCIILVRQAENGLREPLPQKMAGRGPHLIAGVAVPHQSHAACALPAGQRLQQGVGMLLGFASTLYPQ